MKTEKRVLKLFPTSKRVLFAIAVYSACLAAMIYSILVVKNNPDYTLYDWLNVVISATLWVSVKAALIYDMVESHVPFPY